MIFYLLKYRKVPLKRKYKQNIIISIYVHKKYISILIYNILKLIFMHYESYQFTTSANTKQS